MSSFQTTRLLINNLTSSLAQISLPLFPHGSRLERKTNGPHFIARHVRRVLVFLRPNNFYLCRYDGPSSAELGNVHIIYGMVKKKVTAHHESTDPDLPIFERLTGMSYTKHLNGVEIVPATHQKVFCEMVFRRRAHHPKPLHAATAANKCSHLSFAIHSIFPRIPPKYLPAVYHLRTPQVDRQPYKPTFIHPYKENIILTKKKTSKIWLNLTKQT